MDKRQRIHDQNFKNLILDYPREALAFFAADQAQDIDASVTITPLRQVQLKERLGERFRELDVPQPAFDYLACVLAATPAERYLDSDNLVARLNLPHMQWTPERKVDIYAKAIDGC